MLRKLVLTSAALAGAICVSPITNTAAADTIYNVNLAVGAGNSVTGFIQTNCTSCTLVSTNNISPNITGFSLSLNIGANPPVVLTPSDSDGLNVTGTDLTATPTAILFNFGASDGGTVFSFGTTVVGEFCLSSNINSCNPPTPLIFITTGPGVFAESLPGAVTLPVATFSATTPLPAALPLFATGLAGLGLLGWRRKKAAAG